MSNYEHQPSELTCPSCEANLGIEYEDVSGQNGGETPYNCPECGKGMSLVTDYEFSVNLSDEDDE